MKIVVTGARGKLGSVVTEYVRQRGADVLAVDRIPLQVHPLGSYLCVDLTDLGQTYDALDGADAVIHLAAIPSQRLLASARTFVTNVESTWNVFEASARLGVPRVVAASSIQVNSTALPRTPLRFDYLPLDEDHPVSPQDDYGMAKWVGEHLGDMFAEHWGLTAVSFRFPWLVSPGAEVTLPAREEPQPGAALYAYLHVEDAARACWLAATAGLPPHSHTVLFAAAADTYLDLPSCEYARRAFPEAALRTELDGYASLVNCSRAAETIGFVPMWSWRAGDK